MVRARLGRLTGVEEEVTRAGAEQLEPTLQAMQCREAGTTVWDCQLCLLILNLELAARHGSKPKCMNFMALWQFPAAYCGDLKQASRTTFAFALNFR